MQKTVLAVFVEKSDAEEAIGVLEGIGYNPKDMSIVMKNTEEKHEVSANTGTADGAVEGAVTGGALGGIAGIVSAYAIPGLGAFLIGGPIALALGLTGVAATVVAGIATGVLAGGLIGALVNMGLTEDEARIYTNRIQQGAILVAIPINGVEDEADVREIVADANAEDIRVIHNDADLRRAHSHA